MLDVRSFMGTDCDTEHYLVVAKCRGRLAVSKQAAQKFDVERFNLRKLSENEVRKQYQVKVSNSFAASENFSDSEDVNRAWENVKENIKTSAKKSLNRYELKRHKPWFGEECLGSLDQRNHVKMQWVQHPSQSNVDNVNNVRREASRHFRKTKRRII